LKLQSSSPGAPSADAISRYLLSITDPENAAYRSDLASLIEGISLESGNEVVIHMRRSHVRPEALLRIALPGVPQAPFTVSEATADQTVFASRMTAARNIGPQAIVEQKQVNDDAAVSALLAGEIDVLDRVPPWHLDRLRDVENVHVDSYKLPTVHVLVPNLKNPLLAKREFRRALCFGIDRKYIVNRVLLGGTNIAGFEVLSGPLPAGTSLSDPIRYGYNSQLTPRAFEPRLAAILATIAWTNVQNPVAKDTGAAAPPTDDKAPPAEKPKAVDAPMPELTLAHPSDPVARLACQSIQTQLAREGIAVKLREFTADQLAAGKVEYDLRYAELSIWEPLADAQPILGSRGLTADFHSPYLEAALRDLDLATNWKDVRSRLLLVHEIASHELPVIPLWQTVNYFACRSRLRGIGESPMTLYQNVEEWSTAPRANVAQAAAASP
jgi:ABC-type transport system substrate-binding protein